jgi:mono/diheme cytochrome c family protein
MKNGLTLCFVPLCLTGYDDVGMRIYTLSLLMLVGLSSFASAEPAAPSNARTAAQLYRRYCVSCHGNDGKAKTSKGRFSHARDLTDAQWHADVTDERIFNSIMNGRDVSGNMPAFSNKMNEKEVESLVTFVRGLKG